MMTSQSRLTKRPTTLFSLYRLDMQTLQAELLIDKDGFISGARFHLTERRYWYPARLNRWVE